MASNSTSQVPDQDTDAGDIGSSAIFITTVLLLFAVALALFFGTRFVISGVTSNPMFNFINAKAELPASIPKPSTKIDLTSLTPTPQPSPTPVPPPVFVRIANTGGDGVFLRRTPRSSDKLVAWMDGTVLQIVGEDREAEGTVWRHVKDPKGNIGWVPSQYLTAPIQ